ncbi:MAG: hypothetical protein Q9188_002569 [Gyalolechia gomerana]
MMPEQSLQSAPPPVALDGELHHVLPSPSASDIHRKEVSAHLSDGESTLILSIAQVHSPPSKKRKRKHDLEPRSPISRSPDHHLSDWKRVGSDEPGPSIKEREDNRRACKRIRLSPSGEPPKDTLSTEAQPEEPYNPIAHWVTQGVWPQDFHNKGFKMSETAAKKRSRSTSYSQSVKDGDNPRAYTSAYVQVLTQANILMNTYDPQLRPTSASQQLCEEFLDGNHNLPANPLYNDHEFASLLTRLSSRNEARVLRDLTPMIMPSVEHLDILGTPALSDLTEELNAEWTKCNSLAGPRPKPDCAVGLRHSAFNEEEMKRLKFYTAPNRPTLFTENMYFPFLMGEVKCGEQALARADRQNIHSSSVAVNAIVQLFRAIPPTIGEDGTTTPRVHELDRQILAFSISHDNAYVMLYGHYAVIEGDKTFFHRYPIFDSNLAFRGGNKRWRFYQFVRSVYADFAPAHLKRIKSAIAQLPTPSAPVSDAVDDIIQQEGLPASVPSSLDDSVFKRPALPLSVQLQQDKDRLQDQLRESEEQAKKDKEEMEQLKKMVKLLMDKVAVTETT